MLQCCSVLLIEPARRVNRFPFYPFPILLACITSDLSTKGSWVSFAMFCVRSRVLVHHSITLTALVRLQCSREDVYHVIETARKLRIRPSLAFLNSCIRALGEHNDVYGACQVMDRIKSLDNMKPDAISYNSLIFALVQEPWASEVGQSDCLLFLCTISRFPASSASLQDRSNEGHVLRYYFRRRGDL